MTTTATENFAEFNRTWNAEVARQEAEVARQEASALVHTHSTFRGKSIETRQCAGCAGLNPNAGDVARCQKCRALIVVADGVKHGRCDRHQQH